MSQQINWKSKLVMPVSRMSDRKPIIVGHRGARGLAPENTLAAFRVAAELGIDGVEFDVQRTQDGHLVVIHDEDVERTTNGQGRIAELTLAELRRLDAGAWFDDSYRGEGVPTLHDVFEMLRPTGLLLFIELKSPWLYQGMESALAQMIREFDLVDRVQVRSFFHPVLHAMAQVAPEISLSSLWFDRVPSDDEVAFKTIDVLFTLYTPQVIAHIHRRGQQATAWTVNDPDDARRLIEAGIDGLATDFPDRLLPLFEVPERK
ncbi:MAG: glycerophosphodiester phosphodiesterase [Anaerolineae bacterium]|nr:glycerophosphodiester phosphodiesterase [Anaerolineae bacterium]